MIRRTWTHAPHGGPLRPADGDAQGLAVARDLLEAENLAGALGRQMAKPQIGVSQELGS